ncbi:MAG TPA: DUF1631 domain-containing protein [Rhodanobacteraceae bacterium]|nr:DUF1631 domain-containing protein [Rhodanobacteraceae bacterium]
MVEGRERWQAPPLGLPTLADRGDLSPRVRQLLEELMAMASARLEPALRAVLSDLEQQLFKLAEQSHNNTEQQRCFESLREVKRGRADLTPRFVASLEEHLARFDRAPVPAAKAAPDAELELLPAQQLEDHLAIAEMSSRAEVRASAALFELGHRFGVLAGAPVFEVEQLPLGPRALGASLSRALDQLDLPPEHRQLAYRLFERRVLTTIGGFYDAVNEHLVTRRILPHLRVYVARRSAEPAPASRPATTAGETGAATAAGTRGGGTGRDSGSAAATGRGYASDDEGDEAGVGNGNLFTTMRDLLAQRRSVLGLPAEESGEGRAAAPDELQAALSTLQTRPVAPVMVGGKPALRSVQHLRQDMLAQLRQMSTDGRAPRLAGEQRDTVELVSMLFDHLGQELRMGGAAQQLLTKLQVPLLRVALSDTGFFTRRSHPARRLLSTITETAAYWVDSADGEADPGLVEKMQLLVDRVSGEFNGDVGLFGSLLEDLERHMSTLARKADMVERRHVEAAQGRERLDVARERAGSVIAERMLGTRPTSLVRTLLEQAWTDVLALTLLRQGEHSDVFRRRVAVADQLLRRDPKADTEALRQEVEQGLSQVGLHLPDAGQIARKVLDQPVVDFQGEPVTQTELAMKLKQRQRLGNEETAAAASAAAAARREAVPLTTEEQRMLERLKTVPFGTWFEFVQNQQGAVVRRKLAWFSPLTGRCLFVNQRGQRSDERNLEQLARDVVRGQVRLVVTQQDSLIDRAWSAIVGALKQFSGHGPLPQPVGAPA